MSDEIANLDAYQAIADALTEPRTATVDGVSTTSHSIPDLIAADRYIRGQRALSSPTRGLKFIRLQAPGAE